MLLALILIKSWNHNFQFIYVYHSFLSTCSIVALSFVPAPQKHLRAFEKHLIETTEESKGDVEQVREVLAEEKFEIQRFKFAMLELLNSMAKLQQIGLISSEEMERAEKARVHTLLLSLSL